MNKAVLMSVLIVLGAGAANAGDLRSTSGQWQSSGCNKPIQPLTDRSDASALNNAVAAYNRYIEEVNAYNECLRSEAETDMRIIRESSERAQEQALRDANAARPSRQAN